MQQTKLNMMLVDLVKEFGEGATITRKQLIDFAATKGPDYPGICTLANNLKYRAGRGLYKVTLVTTATETKKEKPVLQNVKTKSHSIPQKVKDNPYALFKLLSDDENYYDEVNSTVDHIDDILRFEI